MARILRLSAPRSIPPCPECVSTKSKEQRNREPASPTNRPLQRLHADIIPLPGSLHGNKYALVLMDDYSCYAWVRYIKSKDGPTMAHELNDFFTYLRHQFPHFTISEFKSDRGTGEFCSSAVSLILHAHGILAMPSPAYNQSVNGRIERLIQTLKGTTRTQLLQAGMFNDLRLYAEAFNTAVSLYNIFPSAAMQHVSPFEDLHGRPWDRGYAHLKPFGCLCHVHVPDAERMQQAVGPGKRLPASVAPRSRPGLFIGYFHHSTHVWKIIDLHTLRTGIYRDVIFDEECFPTLPSMPIRLSELK